MRRVVLAAGIGWAVCLLAATAPAQAGPGHAPRSLTDHRLEWPSTDKLLRTLRLEDGTTRVVVAGVSLLGLTAGLVGTFLLLRKRSLTADALSHATLPGVACGFLLAVALVAVISAWGACD